MWHKIINNGKIIMLGIIIVLFPILLNFILLIRIGIPAQLIIGDSKSWLSFWPTYFGAIGTFAMAIITYKTLKQNDKLIKERNTPKLSCSVAVGNSCLLVVLTNISAVPAYDVEISLINKTNKEIYNFDSLCHSLEKVRFDIPPSDSKKIQVIGIEPCKAGGYDGYLSVILKYNGVTETSKIYLEELNVTEWKRN